MARASPGGLGGGVALAKFAKKHTVSTVMTKLNVFLQIYVKVPVELMFWCRSLTQLAR